VVSATTQQRHSFGKKRQLSGADQRPRFLFGVLFWILTPGIRWRVLFSLELLSRTCVGFASASALILLAGILDQGTETANFGGAAEFIARSVLDLNELAGIFGGVERWEATL
jgi:hypothetical protein